MNHKRYCFVKDVTFAISLIVVTTFTFQIQNALAKNTHSVSMKERIDQLNAEIPKLKENIQNTNTKLTAASKDKSARPIALDDSNGYSQDDIVINSLTAAKSTFEQQLDQKQKELSNLEVEYRISERDFQNIGFHGCKYMKSTTPVGRCCSPDITLSDIKNGNPDKGVGTGLADFCQEQSEKGNKSYLKYGGEDCELVIEEKANKEKLGDQNPTGISYWCSPCPTLNWSLGHYIESTKNYFNMPEECKTKTGESKASPSQSANSGEGKNATSDVEKEQKSAEQSSATPATGSR